MSSMEKPNIVSKKKEWHIPDTNEFIDTDIVMNAIYSANSLCTGRFSGIETTALPPLRLRIILDKLANPNLTNEEIYERNKAFAEHLSKRESEFMDPNNPLPTIGIEIEIPNEDFLPIFRSIFDQIDIPNVSETEGKHEMNPNFSYSPWVQARMLQEITNLGIVPLKKGDGKKIIDPEKPLSLHINFGIPNTIRNWERMIEGADSNPEATEVPELGLINDILTFAFSSSNRIKNRKTSESIHFHKGARETLKDTGNNKFIYRVEFRATEFKDYSTYRLLAESQRIMGMFISSVKRQEKVPMSGAEEKLALLWDEFKKEAEAYLYGEEKLETNLFDKYMYLASRVMETRPEVRKNCRALITKYSKRVAEILNLDEDSEISN
ncbi:hypothetical protein K8Q98_00735 [Candidatus Nomurabacteria bacterium]|nr:hypothetical protein [Candidatus Nomurabacteria bacterium]